MDWSLEVVVLPVSDIDRSIAFYRDTVGFHLDHDTDDGHMHVAQLTPPGSGCLIVFGDLPPKRAMEPGGVATGRGLAAGAAGAWLGTALAACAESMLPDQARRRMIAASERDAV